MALGLQALIWICRLLDCWIWVTQEIQILLQWWPCRSDNPLRLCCYVLFRLSHWSLCRTPCHPSRELLHMMLILFVLQMLLLLLLVEALVEVLDPC